MTLTLNDRYQQRRDSYRAAGYHANIVRHAVTGAVAVCYWISGERHGPHRDAPIRVYEVWSESEHRWIPT